MNTLQLAVSAELPIIAVTTSDTLNLVEVIKRLTGKVPLITGKDSDPKPGSVYLQVLAASPGGKPNIDPLALDATYRTFMEKQATLILVNPNPMTGAMFKAGEVPVPKEMLLEALTELTGDEAKADNISKSLGGVGLREATELVALTTARDKALVGNGVVKTRKQFFQGQAGMVLVDTDQPYYRPNDQLSEYAQREGPLFTSPETDFRLVPRGILADGSPGTGKTEGAKFLARSWGVPLYRIDIGATKSKWLGESEGNFIANLNRLDFEEPCIALFDEIEKIFGSGHYDSGTTTTMLSEFLWWLAEHRSRVLVVMTTNDSGKLPRELYRERRIDAHMMFEGVGINDAPEFVMNVLKTFDLNIGEDDARIRHIVSSAYQPKNTQSNLTQVAHSKLTEAVYQWLKRPKADQTGEVAEVTHITAPKKSVKIIKVAGTQPATEPK